VTGILNFMSENWLPNCPKC